MRDGYKIGPFSRHREEDQTGAALDEVANRMVDEVIAEEDALDEVIALAQAPLPDEEEEVVASAFDADDPQDFVDEMIERFGLSLDDAALVANTIARLARRP